jgi:ADP-heptose:LPS heptosyltransferase
VILHTDCRYFDNSKPCPSHKETGVSCGACTIYDPITQRVVIVKLGAAGDVLRTTCILDPLRAAFPSCHVTWITRSDAAGLLRQNPAIDRVLEVESNYLEVILTESFDLAIGPDADPLSASIVSLVQATEKRGFCGDRRGGVTPMNEAGLAWLRMGVNDRLKRENRDTYGTWLYRICDFTGAVAPPSFAISNRARRRAELFLSSNTSGYSRRVIINTGASTRWSEKRWKLRHYVALEKLIAASEPSTALILIGGPAEEADNRELLAEAPGFIDGRTDSSFEDVAALIAACDWILTPDSLAYHLACAVATPAVCLVGPTAPWELDRYGRNVVLHDDRACIACYRTTCMLEETCMDSLTAGKVWSAIVSVIDGTADKLCFNPEVIGVHATTTALHTLSRTPPGTEARW